MLFHQKTILLPGSLLQQTFWDQNRIISLTHSPRYNKKEILLAYEKKYREVLEHIRSSNNEIQQKKVLNWIYQHDRVLGCYLFLMFYCPLISFLNMSINHCIFSLLLISKKRFHKRSATKIKNLYQNSIIYISTVFLSFFLNNNLSLEKLLMLNG